MHTSRICGTSNVGSGMLYLQLDTDCAGSVYTTETGKRFHPASLPERWHVTVPALPTPNYLIWSATNTDPRTPLLAQESLGWSNDLCF